MLVYFSQLFTYILICTVGLAAQRLCTCTQCLLWHLMSATFKRHMKGVALCTEQHTSNAGDTSADESWYMRCAINRQAMSMVTVVLQLA